MFTFFKKNKRSQGVNVLVLSAEGIAHACIAQNSGQPPSLVSAHFYPINRASETASVLKHLVRENGLENASIVTSLMIGDSNLAMVEKPEVSADELRQAIRWKIKDSFPFNIDDAIVDVFDIPQQKTLGRASLVYVTAAEKSFLKQHIKLLEEQKLKVASIDIAELVLRNIAMLLPEAKNGVVLLKFDQTQSLMTLVQDSSLYLARNIDVGYNLLIDQSASILGENSDESMSSQQQQALEQVLDMIVLEVQRSLDYYESHFSKPSINSLVIAPMGRDISNITQYLAKALGLQVRVFDFNNFLDTPEPISDDMQEKCFFAIGAALREENTKILSHKKGVAA